ncbi:hypothetical protein [Bradyrhizobium brasilense]|uniref:Methyl-accepting chemotaxis protein n=1 Tax=Bradyrhizobium brasilense TaxID=1419277 RepID=A0ABY8JFE6_9BRAD|nr:hypothetical protein [Bradyrhizobium brasilense]WFU62683.1 hypothetical protein QA636_35425 [Bradyrhizobium brasilense]
MTTVSETKSRLPAGLSSSLLVFAVVLLGCGYIVGAKIAGLSAALVTSVPVLIMLLYAAVLGAARLLKLRDDQSGDNLYYMGFLFTLTSLAVSLYQFTTNGSAEQIVQNFGIAIASTIAGIALRIFFNQMRRDPVEVEATARMELADASRRVKRELDSTVLEFGYFRRMTQQSLSDALDEMKGLLGEARQNVAGELKQFADDASKPIEEASKKSGASIESLNSRITQSLDAASQRLTGNADQLAASTHSVIRAIEALAAKLDSMQTPEQVIEVKLSPAIQGLSRVVNTFTKGAEDHAKAVEVNLKRTQEISAATAKLIEEIRASENERRQSATPTTGPWSVPGGEMTK